MPYILTIALSSFLLFLIQPIVTKQILPYFGGGSSIWTTNLFFFQTVLLLGYIYANQLWANINYKLMRFIHIGVLIISTGLLFFSSNLMNLLAEITIHPILSQILTLFAIIGLPYFILSVTSPLIQAYFNHSKTKEKQNYKLYAVSNFFSLLGLLVYPFLLEPFLGLGTQLSIWKSLYVIFVGLNIWLMIRYPKFKSPNGTTSDIDQAQDSSSSQIPFKQKLKWIVLSALGSISLSAVSNYLSLDVAGLPFIWVLPLAVYLLSFVLIFSKAFDYKRDFFSWVILAVIPVILLSASSFASQNVVILIPILLILLLILTLFFHGEMENCKPDVKNLTNYYLLTSLGAVFGSAFVSLVAPLVFPDFWELPLILVLAVLLVLIHNYKLPGFNRLKIYSYLATVIIIVLAGVSVYSSFKGVDKLARNYYGVTKIKTFILETNQEEESLQYRTLIHNNITHGMQYLSKPESQLPTTYYNEFSGLGLVNKIIDKQQESKKIAMIGLGTGTVASYCGNGDECRIYEIDSDIKDIAENEFTYLSDARERGAKVQVDLGDARKVIQAQNNSFDLLAIDAFSGDSIPAHLFTDNAIKIFGKQISSEGYLAFHISNRYFDLAPILARLALENNFYSYEVSYKALNNTETTNRWIVFSKSEIDISLYSDYKITKLESDKTQKLWTDDYNSLMHIWQTNKINY